MSKIVHPYSHRLGIIRDWKSRWFATDKNYRANLKADVLIREMLVKELRGMYAAAIEFERNAKQLRIIIKTSRPGIIIGRGGDGSTKLRNKIVALMEKHKLQVPDLKLDIEEIRSPESNAAVVAYMVAEALEKRIRARAPITEEELQKRRERYEDELSYRTEADFEVENLEGKLDEAKARVEALVRSIVAA